MVNLFTFLVLTTSTLSILPCTITLPELLGIDKAVRCEAQAIIDEVNASGYEITDLKTYRPQETFSWHSYGRAMDINPMKNPCLGIGCTDPLSAKYKGNWQSGKNGALTKTTVDIFKKYGWCWGGDWCGKKDYMHFSKPDTTISDWKYHDECGISTCVYKF